MTMPLNFLLWSLLICGTTCSHQVRKWLGSSCICSRSVLIPSQMKTWFQTALAKAQLKERCTDVSKGPLQSTQCSWQGHRLFCRLSAVRIFSLLKIHMKTLHLFSCPLSRSDWSWKCCRRPWIVFCMLIWSCRIHLSSISKWYCHWRPLVAELSGF